MDIGQACSNKPVSSVSPRAYVNSRSSLVGIVIIARLARALVLRELFIFPGVSVLRDFKRAGQFDGHRNYEYFGGGGEASKRKVHI